MFQRFFRAMILAIIAIALAAPHATASHTTKPGRIRGVVTFNGKSVPATVVLDDGSVYSTKRNGVFLFRHVAAGSHQLTATVDGLGTQTKEVTVLPKKRASTLIEVQDQQPPTVPTGVVVYPGQPPVTSQMVKWLASSDGRYGGVVGYKVIAASQSEELVKEAGTTTLAVHNLIPATTYTYRVVAVDAAGNQSAPSEPISLQTEAIVNLSGVVTDEWSGGLPVRRAYVTAKSLTSGLQYPTSTSADGRYELWGLPTGTYQVIVGAVGYKTQTSTLAIDVRVNKQLNAKLIPHTRGWFVRKGTIDLQGIGTSMQIDHTTGTLLVGLLNNSPGIYRYFPDGTPVSRMPTNMLPLQFAPSRYSGNGEYLVADWQYCWWVAPGGQALTGLQDVRRLTAGSDGAILGATENGLFLVNGRQFSEIAVGDKGLPTAVASGGLVRYVGTDQQKLFRLDAGFENELAAAAGITLPFVAEHLAYMEDSSALFAAQANGTRIIVHNAATLAEEDVIDQLEGSTVNGLAAHGGLVYVLTGRQILIFKDDRPR